MGHRFSIKLQGARRSLKFGMPFAIALADQGHRRALAEDPHLKDGLNVAGGKVTYKAVAEAHGLPYVAPEEALAL